MHIKIITKVQYEIRLDLIMIEIESIASILTFQKLLDSNYSSLRPIKSFSELSRSLAYYLTDELILGSRLSSFESYFTRRAG